METKHEILINELGQKVRVYDWEGYQRRLGLRKPWTGKEDLNGKTLVINHTWGVGDVLYSTPALRGLKEKFPKVWIVYISMNPDILLNNPDVDEILHFADYEATVGLQDRMAEDWYWLDYDTPLKGGYDYKIHLRTKPRLNEFLVTLLKKNPKDLNDDERAFVNQASTSIISRYKMVALDMYCWHAHVDPPNKTVHYFPYDHETLMAQKFIEPLRKNNKVITLIPHSSTRFKDYPYWQQVINLCPRNYFWLILDSAMRPEDRWHGVNVYDLSGAFKIRQSAALVIESDLNCSSDTGLLYPRAARGKPCVVTYGPHEPEPFLHYFPSAHGLRVPNLTKTKGMEGMCSTGCFIDTDSCHENAKFSPCLAELEPTRVAAEIMTILES